MNRSQSSPDAVRTRSNKVLKRHYTTYTCCACDYFGWQPRQSVVTNSSSLIRHAQFIANPSLTVHRQSVTHGSSPIRHSRFIVNPSLTAHRQSVTHMQFIANPSLTVHRQSVTHGSSSIRHSRFIVNPSLTVHRQSVTHSSSPIRHSHIPY